MEYNKIIAITGLSGLHELLSSKTDGAIVRSLEDHQTKFVSSRVHNFSQLESIEVYTVRDNVNLVDLFKAIQDSGTALPAEGDAAAVKAFFTKVYPDMDFERIYNSDMKKMVKWYKQLLDNDIEFKLATPPEEVEEDEPTGETEVAEVKAAKPKATKATEVPEKATEAPKKAAEAAKKTAEAPKKKAATATKKEKDPSKKATPAPKKEASAPAKKAAAKAPAKSAPPKKKTGK